MNLRLPRFLSYRSAPAFAVVAAIALWSALSVVNAFGSAGGRAAASHAYEYPYGYPKALTGIGTITGVNGRVRFALGAESDASGTTGWCRITESGTTIWCLDVDQFGLVGKTAELTGTAKINGALTTFVIVAADNAHPGAGRDTFSIQTASGYNRSGVLKTGNIHITS